MINTHSNRLIRHRRIRHAIHGTASRPRIALYRGHKYLYIQAIDDDANRTLIGQLSKSIASNANRETAHQLGKQFGDALKSKKITTGIFDRSGFRYHGAVSAVADGLREAGISM